MKFYWSTSKFKMILNMGLVWMLTLASISTMQSQVPFTCEGQFYITLTNQNNSRLIEVTIDPFTQQVQFNSINNNLGIEINGIGYRNGENLIYGVDPFRGTLYRLDATGAVQGLRNLPLNINYGWLAADITPDGNTLILVGGTNVGIGARDFELALVDLTSAFYPITTIPLQGPITRIYDIAFDPLTGELYGFDSANNRLVKINPATGEVQAPFNSTTQAENVGSLFFTAFGELYAYGGRNALSQNTLYEVNKNTGELTPVATGSAAQGTDACSCPYTVEMTKTAIPERAFPCDDIIYSFGIANGSGREQTNLELLDPLPSDFTFVSIEENPYGGVVISQPGDNFIQITGMTIPIGIDSIRVRVNVGNSRSGIHMNQAQLRGLSPSLGVVRFSDYPKTLVDGDSTPLEIRGIPFDTLITDRFVCRGEDLVLSLEEYGPEYLWSDGFTGSQRTVNQGGVEEAIVIAGCDTAVVIFNIEDSDISVSLGRTDFEINLGDSILVEPVVFNSGDTTYYQWYDSDGNPINCGECTSIWLQPLFSGEYTLVVTNEDGCSDAVVIFVNVIKDRVIFIPNAFSPNGDAINDRFYVQGKGFGKIERFLIFDRWGELIFSGQQGDINEASLGWDGRFRGEKMPPGTYVWRADIRFLDEVVEVMSGDVTLIR